MISFEFRIEYDRLPSVAVLECLRQQPEDAQATTASTTLSEEGLPAAPAPCSCRAPLLPCAHGVPSRRTACPDTARESAWARVGIRVVPNLDATDVRAEFEALMEALRETNGNLVVANLRSQSLAEQMNQLYEEARSAVEAKDEFVAAISHELLTGVNSVRFACGSDLNGGTNLFNGRLGINLSGTFSPYALIEDGTFAGQSRSRLHLLDAGWPLRLQRLMISARTSFRSSAPYTARAVAPISGSP